jgi:YTV
MRQYRLRSIMALIAVIAISIWVGMQIERARSGSRRYKSVVYTVTRPVYQISQTGKTYTVTRPVQVTRGRTRP